MWKVKQPNMMYWMQRLTYFYLRLNDCVTKCLKCSVDVLLYCNLSLCFDAPVDVLLFAIEWLCYKILEMLSWHFFYDEVSDSVTKVLRYSADILFILVWNKLLNLRENHDKMMNFVTNSANSLLNPWRLLEQGLKPYRKLKFK